ncbi:hypothetical protein ACWDYH_17135 [Nocardia goodfellowii]
MDGTDKQRRGSGSRTPEVIERLQRSRDRLRDRRAAQRHRERLVGAAVKQFIAAWQAINQIEQTREDEIADLQRQIVEATARAQTAIVEHQQQQALAAAAIRGQGHSDEETAELLEITVKQARQLISAANAETMRAGTREKPSTTTQAAREADAVARPDASITEKQLPVAQPSEEGSDQMS